MEGRFSNFWLKYVYTHIDAFFPGGKQAQNISAAKPKISTNY